MTTLTARDQSRILLRTDLMMILEASVLPLPDSPEMTMQESLPALFRLR